MPKNTLNLLFGPSLPNELDTVQIAFLSSPLTDPNNSIAVLYAERYLTGNYSTRNSFDLYTTTAPVSGSLSYEFHGSSFGQDIETLGFGGVGTYSLGENETLSFKTLHNPIRINGIHVTPSNAWGPIIEGGVVWRKHTIREEEVDPDVETENQSSWLIRAGLVPDDEVYLIYTVPEVRYGPLNTGTYRSFPGSGFQLREIIEPTSVAAPNQIRFEYPIAVLTRIVVNGTVKFSGSYDGSTVDTYIKSIEPNLKLIMISDSLSPEDEIEITYQTYANSWVYNGYRDFQGIWYMYDCNPEYGHYISDSSGGFQNSIEALLAQTTLYLIPSAFMRVEQDINPGAPDEVNLRVIFESAFNWGETHFIRHLIGIPTEELTARLNDGPSNTWGYAVFGRNYYDEEAFLDNDALSKTLPSMMQLGRVVLGAPTSVNVVSNADIRLRGGGVPEDFPEQAVDTNEEGLDTLRGYFDLGVWEGAAILEGGVVSVRIDASILNTYSTDDVYEIVRNAVPPGIEIHIAYVDSV